MTTFNDYKTKLEEELIDSGFLYSGDVLSGQFYKNKVITEFGDISHDFITKNLLDIYKFSFEKMKSKSKELVFVESETLDLISVFDQIWSQLLSQNYLNFPGFLFFSNNSKSYFKDFRQLLHFQNQKKLLPQLFYKDSELTYRDNKITNFHSPLIQDETNDIEFYLCDKPIQSLVWGLQNMTYQIDDEFGNNSYRDNFLKTYLHEMAWVLYDCDYLSWKIRIVNSQKIRQQKIDLILTK